jgi:hypothetical protein
MAGGADLPGPESFSTSWLYADYGSLLEGLFDFESLTVMRISYVQGCDDGPDFYKVC